MSLEIKVPELGESISSASVASLKVANGDIVKQNQLLFEIETDKVTLEVLAPEDGKIENLLAKEEDSVQTGQVLCNLAFLTKQEQQTLESQNKDKTQAKQKEEKTEQKQAEPIKKQDTLLKKENKPSAKSSVKVFKDTVEVFLDKQLNKVSHSPENLGSYLQNPDREAVEGETKVEMSSIRKKIASNLKFSQESSVSLTTFNSANLSSLLKIRKSLNDNKQTKTRLGITSFFVKAVSNALKEYKIVNAEIAGQSIIYKDYHDIGVAVGTDYGLVVPNVRNCESKTLSDIEQDIAKYVEKANKRQLNIEDIKKGSFTISNGGVYGSLLSTPIINPPQVAILGLHAIKKTPVVDQNNNIVVADVMQLALTYDHRIIDGKEAVSFLALVKEFIENPERLLFEG